MQRQGMRYMENMPHQIDPNPVLDNRDRYYDDSRNNSGELNKKDLNYDTQAIRLLYDKHEI